VGEVQGGFKAVLVDVDSYFLELSRYLHFNPVRARMVTKLLISILRPLLTNIFNLDNIFNSNFILQQYIAAYRQYNLILCVMTKYGLNKNNEA
jgi:hypothetical protein